jgi:hypothetical protein
MLTCSVTCEEKMTRRLTLWKHKWHLLLGMWHWGDILEENVDVNWYSFLLWKRHVTLWSRSWTSNEICQTYTLVVNSKVHVSCMYNASHVCLVDQLAVTKGYDFGKPNWDPLKITCCILWKINWEKSCACWFHEYTHKMEWLTGCNWQWA